MSRQPVYTYNECWIICEKVREKTTNIGHQANHLGTPQNNLGTPLGVPTPSLRTTALEYKDSVKDMSGSSVFGKCC